MKTSKTSDRIPGSLITLLLLIFVSMGCGSGSMESGSGTGSGNSGPTGFASTEIGPDDTFSHTFENTGTVEYYCDIHTPDMQGKVAVSTDAETSGQDTVEMINTQFVPSQITVAPNTEVVWINRDNFVHTVNQGNPTTGGNGDDDGAY